MKSYISKSTVIAILIQIIGTAATFIFKDSLPCETRLLVTIGVTLICLSFLIVAHVFEIRDYEDKYREAIAQVKDIQAYSNLQNDRIAFHEKQIAWLEKEKDDTQKRIESITKKLSDAENSVNVFNQLSDQMLSFMDKKTNSE